MIHNFFTLVYDSSTDISQLWNCQQRVNQTALHSRLISKMAIIVILAVGPDVLF